MLNLKVGDRLIWALDRTRIYHVVMPPTIYRNGVVEVRLENAHERFALSTAWNRGGVLTPEQFDVEAK